jgi:aminoglycoside phosphotransferase (APT) family kinase protein
MTLIDEDTVLIPLLKVDLQVATPEVATDQVRLATCDEEHHVLVETLRGMGELTVGRRATDRDCVSPLDVATVAKASPEPRDIVDLLVRRVRRVVPELAYTNARLEDRGGDHRLLILDETCVIRFPRAGMHDLDLEMAVLAALQRYDVLPTPVYCVADPAGAFVGYHFISGVELTVERFAALPKSTQHRLLDQAADFLKILHGLSPAEVWPGEWRRAWTAADYARQARDGRVALIVRNFPELSDELEAFFARYEKDECPDAVILHGDLVTDHILLDRDGDRLAGIIDFGDVALGDPAQDLMGFWAYGPEAVAYIAHAYAGVPETELVHRSHGAFVRHRIDSFWDALIENGAGFVADEVARLAALLSRYAGER